ncbi:MAG: hypothetical protein NVSMB25_15760 [Thermoleophilaceae bacterium]
MIAFAVVCCAGGPLIAGVVGSLAVGGVLGVAAGAVIAAAVAVAVTLRVRSRRRCNSKLYEEAGG